MAQPTASAEERFERVKMRALRLAEVQREEGWAPLLEEIERKLAEHEKKLLRLARDRGAAVEDLKRDFDYTNGWDDALKWVTRLIPGAQRLLERELERETSEGADEA